MADLLRERARAVAVPQARRQHAGQRGAGRQVRARRRRHGPALRRRARRAARHRAPPHAAQPLDAQRRRQPPALLHIVWNLVIPHATMFTLVSVY